MTVIPQPSPSRAGSLPLIADDLALDFANTESGRGFPSHENHFREAANVVEWLRHAKALANEDADWLRKRVSERADLAARSPGDSGRASRGDPRCRRRARPPRQAAGSGARESVGASCAICRQG